MIKFNSSPEPTIGGWDRTSVSR